MREAIERVRQMEAYFDKLQDVVNKNSDALWDDASVREIIGILTRYYEGGQWLKDYELDERGMLPGDLKRGVLAQDAVYDLLEMISDIQCRYGEGF